MLSLLLLLACETLSTPDAPTCALGAPTLSPTSAAPGDIVVITLAPLTEAWDTAVTVGAARATLSGVDRVGCDDCDDCLDTGGCSACDDACDDACGSLCDACVETVTFVVPELAAGEYPVVLVNRHGRSADIALTVVAAAEPKAP